MEPARAITDIASHLNGFAKFRWGFHVHGARERQEHVGQGVLQDSLRGILFSVKVKDGEALYIQVLVIHQTTVPAPHNQGGVEGRGAGRLYGHVGGGGGGKGSLQAAAQWKFNQMAQRWQICAIDS